jgi:uncharacterized protein YkwD
MLKQIIFIGLILITLCFTSIGWMVSKADNHPSYASRYEVNEERLFELIQNWRSSQGKSQYIVSDDLCTIAEKRLEEVKVKFNHDGFQTDWVKQSSNMAFIGENLSELFLRNEDVLTGWLNSPGHRENLEDGFTHSCLRCTPYQCVHIFGRF